MFADLLIKWDRSAFTPDFCLRDAGLPEILPRGNPELLWFEGFIANRSELIQQRDLPRSISDSQLLLYLYQYFENYTPQLIAGSFTWVIWDPNRQMLVAARDRMGNYGLYYAVHTKTVLIANRVGPLLDLLPQPHEINPRSVVAFIDGGVPLEGETFYENLRTVEPGSLLTVTRDNIITTHYWDIEPQPTLKLSSDLEYAEAYRELLFRVVAGYIPPRKVGVTLSSGMDSSSVAAAIQAVAPDVDLTAFSWATPELPDSNESQYSSLTSKYLNIKHVDIAADQYWSLRPKEGIETSVASPFYHFYSDLWGITFDVIRQHNIDIAFTGITGDHLFGGDVFGYPDLLLTGQWFELIRQIRRNLPYSEANLKEIIWVSLFRPIARTFLPFLRKKPTSVVWLAKSRHEMYNEYFLQPEKVAWMLPGRKERLDTLRDRKLRYSTERLNLMATSYNIELRHPLLDHRLIEFSACLPTSQTYRAAVRKVIMRNAMRGYLPDDIVDLIYKIYPSAIADRGLKDREQAKVWDLMTNMRAAQFGFVDEKSLQESYRAYLEGRQKDRGFWNTLTLEDWLRRYF